MIDLVLSLNLVGMQHGYFLQEEFDGLIERIKALRTDILFVGLGSPKQEKWIYRLVKDPSRFKRQKVVPIFILRMLKEALLSKF